MTGNVEFTRLRVKLEAAWAQYDALQKKESSLFARVIPPGGVPERWYDELYELSIEFDAAFREKKEASERLGDFLRAGT